MRYLATYKFLFAKKQPQRYADQGGPVYLPAAAIKRAKRAQVIGSDKDWHPTDAICLGSFEILKVE